jgi:hypothetical protein
MHRTKSILPASSASRCFPASAGWCAGFLASFGVELKMDPSTSARRKGRPRDADIRPLSAAKIARLFTQEALQNRYGATAERIARTLNSFVTIEVVNPQTSGTVTIKASPPGYSAPAAAPVESCLIQHLFASWHEAGGAEDTLWRSL